MIEIGDKEFALLVGYLQKNFGINLTKKRTLIESRLYSHLLAGGFCDYETFLRHVFSDTTGNEMSQVINRLTTNYSYFMREWDHFVLLKSQVLSQIKAIARDKDLRIWSAGCSTGQEPYMLAMMLADFFGKQKAEWDAKVLATDISQKVLETAVQGVYDNEYLKNVPASWKLAYFDKLSASKWVVKQAIKDEVIFRRFNLMEERFPFKKKFHIIFCRNVMIYFNMQTKDTLIEKLYNATAEGGYLFVGQSETLDKSRTRYDCVVPSVYRKG